jgi:V(D)J recombination-activating protein 1
MTGVKMRKIRLIFSILKSLDEHLREHLGLQPSLMMPGNYARCLFDPKNVDIVTSLITDDERRIHVSNLITLFSKMRTIYSSKQPLKTMPRDAQIFQETALEFAFCLGQHFSYYNRTCVRYYPR